MELNRNNGKKIICVNLFIGNYLLLRGRKMNKTRTIITLVSSFLIFAVGVFRILNESLTFTPLFVAYIFVIAGLIGVIASGVKLKKIES